MNDDQKQMSRWRWLGLFVGSYAAALLITLAIYTAITLRSNHFDGEVFWLIAGVFPAGLFPLLHLPSDGEWWIWGGYAVYVLLAAVGVVFRKRIVFLILLILLVFNISGCVVVIRDMENKGWQCRATGSPTRSSLSATGAESSG